MKHIHGKLLIVTGFVHSFVVAPIVYGSQYWTFLKRGLFDVSPKSFLNAPSVLQGIMDITAESAVWFFIGGVVLMMLGHLAFLFEKKLGSLPRIFAWELLVTALLFSWMLPISGFPVLLLPQAIFLLIRSRRRPEPEELAGLRSVGARESKSA